MSACQAIPATARRWPTSCRLDRHWSTTMLNWRSESRPTPSGYSLCRWHSLTAFPRLHAGVGRFWRFQFRPKISPMTVTTVLATICRAAERLQLLR